MNIADLLCARNVCTQQLAALLTRTEQVGCPCWMRVIAHHCCTHPGIQTSPGYSTPPGSSWQSWKWGSTCGDGTSMGSTSWCGVGCISSSNNVAMNGLPSDLGITTCVSINGLVFCVYYHSLLHACGCRVAQREGSLWHRRLLVLRHV